MTVLGHEHREINKTRLRTQKFMTYPITSTVKIVIRKKNFFYVLCLMFNETYFCLCVIPIHKDVLFCLVISLLIFSSNALNGG
jgi:hypothetical protein